VTPYLADSQSALFAVNLESPFGNASLIADTTDADMNLCADEGEVRVLTEVGIDLVTTANNHMADCPAAGASHTAQVAESAGIHALGGSDVVYLPAGKQMVAFLALDAYSNGYKLDVFEEVIRTCREKSDLVVVSLHWGNEYQAGPTFEQEVLAQGLIDAGADLVWGHHPHVLQRLQWYESTIDGHRGLVLYSLGNLLADQYMLQDAMRTALVEIEFKSHEIRGIEVIPLMLDTQSKQVELVTQKDILKLITDRLSLPDLSVKGVKIGVWGE